MYICKECGGKMKDIGEDLLLCEECGFSIDLEDYDEDSYDDYYSSFDIEIPEYCGICGGPFPNCMSSCKLFDD